MHGFFLQVNGLKDGDYGLTIDGAPAGKVTARELAAGVNLTDRPVDPKKPHAVAAQGKAVLAAVAAKEAVVGTWRGLSQRAHAAGADPKLKEELAALTAKVEEADAKIREAAKPRTIKFAVTPVESK